MLYLSSETQKMIIFNIFKITEWFGLHKFIQLSCLSISVKRWIWPKASLREEDVLVNLPPKAFNLRIMQNWGMSEDERIWDPFYFSNAFHFSLPAALFSTHSFQQCFSHPPHSLAMADTELTQSSVVH